MFHLSPLRLLPALSLLLLAGCKMQTGSYQIDAGKSLTLQRTTQFFWSSKVERWLTVSRMPDCQRKHRLDDDSGKRFSAVEVRRIDEQNYQIDDDGSLYLANLEQCTLTALPEKTAREGEPLGKFTAASGDKLPFTAVPQPAAAPK